MRTPTCKLANEGYIAMCDFVSSLCFRVAGSLLAVGLGSCALGINPFKDQTAHAFGYQTYSANISVMNQYAYDDFPEYVDNWCGVASLTMINDYAYSISNNGNNPYLTQYAFGNPRSNPNPGLLNTASAESPWGYPGGNVNNATFSANISKDLGTDPRSLVWGIYTSTPYGFYYHNYIYPGGSGVLNATRNFASDYGAHGTNVPIAVDINGGAHTVVVGGVQASQDPSLNPNTATFNYILVYDPWYGSNFPPTNFYNDQGEVMWQSYYDWSTMAKWWGRGYNTSNGTPPYDPDPSTSPGNYYNVPPLSGHWNGNYVTIEQDNIPPSTYSENIALDNNGNPVPHN